MASNTTSSPIIEQFSVASRINGVFIDENARKTTKASLKYPCMISPIVNLKYSTPFSLSTAHNFPVHLKQGEEDNANPSSSSNIPVIVVNRNGSAKNVHSRENNCFSTDSSLHSRPQFPQESAIESKLHVVKKNANTEYVYEPWEKPFLTWHISGRLEADNCITNTIPIELFEQNLKYSNNKNLFECKSSSNSSPNREDYIFPPGSEQCRIGNSEHCNLLKTEPKLANTHITKSRQVEGNDSKSLKHSNLSGYSSQYYKSCPNLQECSPTYNGVVAPTYMTCANPYCQQIFKPYDYQNYFYQYQPDRDSGKRRHHCKYAHRRKSRSNGKCTQYDSSGITNEHDFNQLGGFTKPKSGLSMQKSETYDINGSSRKNIVSEKNCKPRREMKVNSVLFEISRGYGQEYKIQNEIGINREGNIFPTNCSNVDRNIATKLNFSKDEPIQTKKGVSSNCDNAKNILCASDDDTSPLEHGDLEFISTPSISKNTFEDKNRNFTSEYVRKLNRRYMKLAPSLLISPESSIYAADRDQNNDNETVSISRRTITVPNSFCDADNSSGKNTLAETEATYLEASISENNTRNDTALESEGTSFDEDTLRTT